MSYWFRMSLKKIEETSLMDYIMELSRSFMEHCEEIIDENKFWIPSVETNVFFEDLEEKEYQKYWKRVDQEWLYHLFSVKLVYWPEKELLGLVGCLPNAVKEVLTTIEFQNRTDQNYDYSEWSGIDYFKGVIDRFQYADLKSIALFFKDDENEFADDLDYFRKSAVYQTIYKELDLNNWLWNKSGNFKAFSIQTINSTENHLRASTAMECVRQSLVKTEKEEGSKS